MRFTRIPTLRVTSWTGEGMGEQKLLQAQSDMIIQTLSAQLSRGIDLVSLPPPPSSFSSFSPHLRIIEVSSEGTRSVVKN